MAFLDTAGYGLQANIREADHRIWNDRTLPSPEDRLVPLPWHLNQPIRELGVQNIVWDTEYKMEEAEAVLDYVLRLEPSIQLSCSSLVSLVSVSASYPSCSTGRYAEFGNPQVYSETRPWDFLALAV